MLKYHQQSYNSCCLSSLASSFHSIGDDRAISALVNKTEEPLTLQTDKFSNGILFSNAIIKNRMHIKAEHNIRCNLKV